MPAEFIIVVGSETVTALYVVVQLVVQKMVHGFVPPNDRDVELHAWQVPAPALNP